MKRKGITLVELVIVLALLSIISSIAAINLLSSTEIARLRSDVQSAIVMQGAIELYTMKSGRSPNVNNASELILRLRELGHIRHITNSTQSQDATWFFDTSNNKLFLDLRQAGQHINSLASSLSEQERQHIKIAYR